VPTAKTLRRWSQQAERDRIRWQAEGEKWIALAKIAERQRDQWAREADEMDSIAGTNEVLTKTPGLSRVDSTPMEDSHKLAISRGRSSGGDRAFKVACRSKGYTLTSLAAAVGCDVSLLSKYRQKLRPIPQERAEKIAQLIPWPADKGHWLGGIVPKD